MRNGEGTILMVFLAVRRWAFRNGATEGDWDSKCTFTGGKGDTVIDYIVGNREVK